MDYVELMCALCCLIWSFKKHDKYVLKIARTDTIYSQYFSDKFLRINKIVFSWTCVQWIKLYIFNNIGGISTKYKFLMKKCNMNYSFKFTTKSLQRIYEITISYKHRYSTYNLQILSYSILPIWRLTYIMIFMFSKKYDSIYF